MLRHLDLFSGIGGFAVAAQQVGGIETKQFVEIDPYCQRVLAKRFPGVVIHGDIKTYTANLGDFDLISLGFPCQDVSLAGKGKGIKEGTRSGLFYEAIRIIRVVRPQYVVVENTPGLLSNGMGVVLGELSSLGFDAEWDVVSCADVGGVHRRHRVWLVATNTNSVSKSQSCPTA